jgi:DNA-binding Lrp family transcriptional regulator
MNSKKSKTQKKELSTGSNEQNLAPYMALLKDKLNFQIIMLILSYGELNVTEISKMLNQSKTTISRRLIDMEGEIVEYKETFKEKEIEGRITPKYYRIRDEFYRKLQPIGADQIQENKSQFYRDLIEILRNGVEISRDSLDMINPLLDYLSSQADDPEKAKKAFDSHIFNSEFMLTISWLSEAQYQQLIQYLSEFSQKTEELLSEVPSEEKRPYLFIGSLFNIGKMLECQAKMKPKRKIKKGKKLGS